jgi:hypothetical protein
MRHKLWPPTSLINYRQITAAIKLELQIWTIYDNSNSFQRHLKLFIIHVRNSI